MELRISSHCVIISIEKQMKENEYFLKNKNSTRPSIEESMFEKQYPYPELNVSHIFDSLITKKLIKPPEPKCIEEVGKINNSRYFKYYQVVSHSIQKCFVFKYEVLTLAKDGKIVLDTDNVEDVNIASTTTISIVVFSPSSAKKLHYFEVKSTQSEKKKKILFAISKKPKKENQCKLITLKKFSLINIFEPKNRIGSFQAGDLVLVVKMPITLTRRIGSKFISNSGGLYVIQETDTNDAHKLINQNRPQTSLVNNKFLKRYIYKDDCS
ncbi:hypothetical protein CDL12_24638 [Handroanthus impetiginosus]|uniref:Uncharacterized protein n=1 Tax=Handroanthus impetiginosus TaxID=429701 RepID=A0A2G9GCC1_9LAMI|nr:hypothetical protein CDL12_24638 [Handroanthus impetiginosus]